MSQYPEKSPEQKAKYEAKMEVLRGKIRTLLEDGRGKLSPNLFQLLNLTESPKSLILKHIVEPGLKLMDLERILMNICPHDKPRIQHGESGQCPECRGYVGGWWCPKSPDNSCYYHSEPIVKNGSESVNVVVLENGEHVELPRTHNPDNESEDWCIFCGAPDERK